MTDITKEQAERDAARSALQTAAEAFDSISGLSRHLRQGGCDQDDLAGLEEGLSEAVDTAFTALTTIRKALEQSHD